MSDSVLKTTGTEPRVSLLAANALYLLALAGLVVVSLFSDALSSLFAALFPGAGAEAVSGLVDAAYYLPFMVVPALLALRRAQAWDAARVKPIRPGQMLAVVGLSLAGLLFVQYVSVLWTLLLEALHVPYLNVDLGVPATTSGLTAMVISVGMVPGICEELLFRGVILSAYERQGTKKAIVISAVLFTLLHGSLAGLPTQLFLGLVLGYVTFACDSLYASIAYHTAHNAAVVLIAAWGAGAGVDTETRALLEQGLFAYLGGWPGVIWTIVYAVLLGIALQWFFRAMERARKRRGGRALPTRREKMGAGARALLIVALLLAAGLYALNTLAAVL